MNAHQEIYQSKSSLKWVKTVSSEVKQSRPTAQTVRTCIASVSVKIKIPLWVCWCWLKLLSFSHLQISSLISFLFFMCIISTLIFSVSHHPQNPQKKNKTKSLLYPSTFIWLTVTISDRICLYCVMASKKDKVKKHFLWMLIPVF